MSEEKDNVVSIAIGNWSRFEKSVRSECTVNPPFTSEEWNTILGNSKPLFIECCKPIKFETVAELKKYAGELRKELISREVSKQQLFVLINRMSKKNK